MIELITWYKYISHSSTLRDKSKLERSGTHSTICCNLSSVITLTNSFPPAALAYDSVSAPALSYTPPTPGCITKHNLCAQLFLPL